MCTFNVPDDSRNDQLCVTQLSGLLHLLAGQAEVPNCGLAVSVDNASARPVVAERDLAPLLSSIVLIREPALGLRLDLQLTQSAANAAAAYQARAAASRGSPLSSHHAAKASGSIGTRNTSTPPRCTSRFICSLALRHVSYSGSSLPPSARPARSASECSGAYQGRPTPRGRSTVMIS